MHTHILTRLGTLLRALVTLVPSVLIGSPLLASDAAADELPSVAFYYAAKPPVELLNQFDWVVIDADSATDGERRDIEAQGAKTFAYVSIGEWEPERASTRGKPDDALVAENPDWNSQVADLSRADWRDFLHRRIDELWQQGYRAFFFDTLDSYYRFAESEKDIKAQQAGLVTFVDEVHRRHPGIDVMLNRGFEVLDQVHNKIVGVAAESLYQRWTPSTKIYGPMASNDTQWLTGQLERVNPPYSPG
ncbi:endo alpha-1,4 polygalactosaminidase [Vreelandella subglaciescola]|uniref:Extracellular protein n=1 Tax=Vreelandella subglaciescola TaxID=29571 RepID=A0A1M7IGA0_9GAMM|nr:endo alpha-1,4 polygalactosaminidase [Halomonas subglaciescola]SHM39866.1 extracellular protein [Halomonas subglaciescola]